jgi:hypothetical protein
MEVERAPSIWVDAADSVICRFARQFDSVGNKSLMVKVEGVKPTDYDNSNNSVSGTIKIVRDTIPFTIPFRKTKTAMYDLKNKYHYKYQNNGYTDALSYDQEMQAASYSAYINERLPSTPWFLSITESSGEHTITPAVAAQFECFDNFEDANYSYRQCFKQDFVKGVELSIISYTLYGNESTYVDYSRNWHKTVFHGGAGVYSRYNGAPDQEHGVQLFPITGDDWRIEIRLEVDGSNYIADKSMTSLPYSEILNRPWKCSGTFCFEQYYSRIGKYFEHTFND